MGTWLHSYSLKAGLTFPLCIFCTSVMGVVVCRGEKRKVGKYLLMMLLLQFKVMFFLCQKSSSPDFCRLMMAPELKKVGGGISRIPLPAATEVAMDPLVRLSYFHWFSLCSSLEWAGEFYDNGRFVRTIRTGRGAIHSSNPSKIVMICPNKYLEKYQSRELELWIFFAKKFVKLQHVGTSQ